MPTQTKYTVTTSSELMQNYLQSDILVPQDTFIALQTTSGASLLFSIGTDNAFNLTMEVANDKYGWQLVDLSPSGARCSTFAAAQSGGNIDLAMVINDGANDQLYLSLSNSDSNLSWATNISWTACPFNAVDATGRPITPPSPLKIAGVLISEATDAEYIVVDVLRDPTDPAPVLSRYYIDVSTPSAPKWMPHDFPEDIQSGGYQSCLGRAANAHGVDGLYTKGTIDSSPQLVYVPLYNWLQPTMPPASSRLTLPKGLAADAIAALRNADNTSDLYVCASGGLYWFASTNQGDGAVGKLVASNAVLTGVSALFASADDGNVTVWGLNANREVFYLACPAAEITTASAWSVPMPLMTGVDAISPYVDRGYSANTFFAHNGTSLVKLVKTPSTGLWSQRNVTLPPTDTMQDATEISSYTTYILVTDENGQAAPNVSVSLTATSVTSVHINHVYYVVGPTAVTLTTDDLGTITIVESVGTLAGTRFNAVVDQAPSIAINTLDAAFQRNAQYADSTALANAKVVDDYTGASSNFIPPKTDSKMVKAAAASNGYLASAYKPLALSPTPPAQPMIVLSVSGQTALAAAGFPNSIFSDIGDLFKWLESGIEAVISFVEDETEKLWYFVATIGKDVYSAVMDCVEKVVAAVTWVYNAIKIAIEDIIKFLEFLFGWQDILTTHRVMKNVFLLTAEDALGALPALEADLTAIVPQIQGMVDGWSDLPAQAATSASTANSKAPPAGQNTAPSNLGVHHYQGNCGSSSSSYLPTPPADSVFGDLTSLFSTSEVASLFGVLQTFEKDVIGQLASLNMSEVVSSFKTDAYDAVKALLQDAIDALIDALQKLDKQLLDVYTKKIDIPVLSWLYKKLSGDDLTYLDLVCLIAAIPATIIYKAGANATPFPKDDAFTKNLLAATKFSQVRSAFTSGTTLDENKLKTFAVIDGVAALTGSLVLVISAAVDELPAKADSKLKTVLASIGAASNLASVSPNLAVLLNNTTTVWSDKLSALLTRVSILKGTVAVLTADSDNKNIPLAMDGVDLVIGTAANIPVIDNLVENVDYATTTYQSLFFETFANLEANFAAMMELLIAVSEEEDLLAVQWAMMGGYGVMITTAGAIYKWAPNQKH